MKLRLKPLIIGSLLLATSTNTWATDPYKAIIKDKKRIFARALKSKKLKFTIITAEGRLSA
ncbi:MAG: hypothetical protein KDD56_04095, partial [Bdellovibrionales bacterium]|nr:hypothetical protein [Bdellovibrionales bacterium]